VEAGIAGSVTPISLPSITPAVGGEASIQGSQSRAPLFAAPFFRLRTGPHMAQERTAYDAKLESILRTAAVIFAEKGYHQASIRDIARATRVSLSGLYYYFQSKEELLFLIEDHALETLLTRLQRGVSSTDDPREKLRLLIDNHLRFFVQNMAEMKVLSHEAESLTGEFRANLNGRKRRITHIASEILQELDPHSPLDARVSAFSLFGMMNWVYAWYRPDRDVGVDRLVADMTRIFLHGYVGGAVEPRLTDSSEASADPLATASTSRPIESASRSSL
jgi:AcrR family transcriptional regulator